MVVGPLASSAWAQTAKTAPPNVVLIITDDQGYGDLGVHGNTMIRTPHLDQLAKQSARLTNFHVDPTCAETRSALMTGKYSCRVGVWHTIMGRSILRPDEKIMPQYFAEAGYRTGHFGKWHLGDNWPYRSHDRGFHETLSSGGGGVGQSPDAWGNDYFDDTFSRNGTPEKQTGYCTDVWFRNATNFIEKNREKPFFCYIATNAPHGPYNVDPKYARPYVERGVPQPMANFYGMIENIDENIGQLLNKLDDWKLSENTIVIFMTDNGTAAGVGGGMGGGKNAKKKGAQEEGTWKGFAAGMRAQKGSQYDGGHRVPCFIRAPFRKDITPGQQVSELASHFDLLPTLAELCGLPVKGPEIQSLDGRSLVSLLSSEDSKSREPRAIVVHSQRVELPEMWRKCAVMTQQHRLVDGKELYDIVADPAQRQDIAAENGPLVEKLRGEYERWWKHVSPRFGEFSDIPLGAEQAPSQELCCHDWHPGSPATPWNQSGQGGVAGNPPVNGLWAVRVARAGRYRFTLRLRPEGTDYEIPAGEAKVKIGDVEGTAKVPAGSKSATIELDLKPTEHVMLQTWLTQTDGQSRGAYYTTVRRLE
ncbi:arylsulfatase [Anatilimnocola sp. NA78]|uniref:arylsulfatase n=1 Tax=Anatilimnocola sp. NA78 TaxID=3415683 RepID=UPI003CE48E46